MLDDATTHDNNDNANPAPDPNSMQFTIDFGSSSIKRDSSTISLSSNQGLFNLQDFKMETNGRGGEDEGGDFLQNGHATDDFQDCRYPYSPVAFPIEEQFSSSHETDISTLSRTSSIALPPLQNTLAMDQTVMPSPALPPQMVNNAMYPGVTSEVQMNNTVPVTPPTVNNAMYPGVTSEVQMNNTVPVTPPTVNNTLYAVETSGSIPVIPDDADAFRFQYRGKVYAIKLRKLIANATIVTDEQIEKRQNFLPEEGEFIIRMYYDLHERAPDLQINAIASLIYMTLYEDKEAPSTDPNVLYIRGELEKRQLDIVKSRSLKSVINKLYSLSKKK